MSESGGVAAADQGVKMNKYKGMQVYGRMDKEGRPGIVDAIDQDERAINEIADRLQRRGFGVMRKRDPRSGKVYYILKAQWVGQGEPPEH
ncbi:MAG: hypothetical protein JO329_16100, partial [Planctomycetaceae bacterium]|nr:hypothetical protein [Planctomycetaceae bacterium]